MFLVTDLEPFCLYFLFERKAQVKTRPTDRKRKQTQGKIRNLKEFFLISKTEANSQRSAFLSLLESGKVVALNVKGRKKEEILPGRHGYRGDLKGASCHSGMHTPSASFP